MFSLRRIEENTTGHEYFGHLNEKEKTTRARRLLVVSETTVVVTFFFFSTLSTSFFFLSPPPYYTYIRVVTRIQKRYKLLFTIAT